MSNKRAGVNFSVRGHRSFMICIIHEVIVHSWRVPAAEQQDGGRRRIR